VEERAESRTASFAAIVAVAMIAQQIASKAARDTLFLATYDAEQLPQVMLASAGLALVGVLFVSQLVARLGPARVVPVFFLLSAAAFVAETLLRADHPREVAYALYLHVGLLGAVSVSGFWSVMNERFDPHAAKRFIGRIAAGAAIGGVVGGLAAERVSAMAGTAALLPALAVVNAFCAVGVSSLGRGVKTPLGRPATLEASPFLRRIAAVVVLLAVVGALLDYALKAAADARYEEVGELGSFFALYYLLVGIATFAVQWLVSRRALVRLGIGGTLGILPVAVVLGSALGSVVMRLWSVVVLRGVATVLENSVFRSAYELLYTPVSPRRKRPTKILIDVAGTRVGDALGSGLVLVLLLFVDADPSVRICVAIAGAVAVLALLLILRLQRGYVAQLAESLRTGQVVLDDEGELDATTRQALAETRGALDRIRMMGELEALRRGRLSESLISHQPTGETLELAEALSTGDEEKIAQALRGKLGPAQIPMAVGLLDGEHARAATKALRRAAPKHVGQLVDLLLEDGLPLGVRRKLPGIVASADNPRAVRGLMESLEAERFEVRYRSGIALASLVARRPELRPEGSQVFAVVLREVSIGEKVWASQRLLEMEPDDGLDEALGSVLRERRDRSLEHVFNVLALALDRDSLRLALRALTSEEKALRGTALEYLDNVLPDAIRERLWPYLTGAAPTKRRERPAAEIVDDLLRSMDSLRVEPR